MSKKEKIVELLQKDKDIDEICTELDVTKSYVYRIQREIEESKGNNDDSTDGKDDNFDDLVKHPAGGFSVNVEKDDGNLEEKENKGDTNHTGAVGGVKKKKKSRKKKEKVNSEQEINEQNSTLGGIKSWMTLKWKKLLLTLTLLILLITAILLSVMKKPEEPINPVNQSRYPVLR